MPQMAPIGWLSLFIIFSFAFMIFNMMNFYSFTPSSPKSLQHKSLAIKTMIWKW